MDYSTYWSLLDTPSKNIQSNSVCLYIAIGAGILWFLVKKFKNDMGNEGKSIILWGTGVFSLIWFAGYLILTFFYHDQSKELTLEMLNSPTTPRVEGVISNFERTFRYASHGSGETIEKFMVDSVQFAYGDAPIGKFNSFTQVNNNIIFDGQKVRITYTYGSNYGDNYNSILKLEVAK